MSISRRKWITAGIAAGAGAAGLDMAGRAAAKYGLIAPDHGGLYGIGETLDYVAARALASHSLAREFPPSMISKRPFPNEVAPPKEAFRKLQAGGFADWRLSIDGMVTRPASFSIAQLKQYPSSSQITELACEEGWSYIAQWTGVALHHVLDEVGVDARARWLVYFSIQRHWWDSIDMAESRHPQTFLAYGLNGGELPVGNGGPLRMRVPRQLGYKNVKFITRLTLTDDLKKFGKGLGSAPPEGGYAWYAGI